MRFSCSLPTSGPIATRANIRRLATLIDRLGYQTIWISDHVIIPRRIESRYPYRTDGAFGTPPDQPYYEPVGVVGFVAGLTEQARIGTSVLVLPYRHPIVLAKTIASLDDLSDGRITLGVGVGWMREEFELLGLPDGFYEKRGAVGDEWIRILRAIWTEENPRFDGQFYTFADFGARPKPVQGARQSFGWEERGTKRPELEWRQPGPAGMTRRRRESGTGRGGAGAGAGAGSAGGRGAAAEAGRASATRCKHRTRRVRGRRRRVWSAVARVVWARCSAMADQVVDHRPLQIVVRSTSTGLRWHGFQCCPAPLKRAPTMTRCPLSTIPLPIGYCCARKAADRIWSARLTK